MEDPKGRVEQLRQIAKAPVWDGNLISKLATTELNQRGYIKRIEGWSILAPKGLKCLIDLGYLTA